MSEITVAKLQAMATDFAPRSYAPYSRNGAACIALLSDGTCVPGVRVENASFPLLISATLNALSTALAQGRNDFVAFVSSRPISHVERDLLEPFLPGILVAGSVARSPAELPETAGILDPFLRSVVSDAASGLAGARSAAEFAWVPESNFPVGCIVGSTRSGYVSGVNVEHPDWNLGICAERNAIGTAVTYGLDILATMYLTCIKDPNGSPCGACRQVLVEHVAEMELVMDRGDRTPEITTPSALLPDSFGGSALLD